ncbi:MAG: hypothetical protein NC318_02100 [Blautia sp.]|nr:hypothetical protein [Lachnoclostridium sp.]MCM1210372.1 hypothetical protein [Blautia sp.]
MAYEELRIVISALLLIIMLLITGLLYGGLYQMARIENWNGKRYCYLGYVPIRKGEGGFVIRIGKRMVDLSYTTRYRIRPGNAFCRRNRYRDVIVYADRGRAHLVLDGREMKTEIPF